MRKTVVVLGMHRSGTSLVGELIHLWGGYAGDSGELLSGDSWNARGYWEFLPLIRFNDELLARLEATWIAPPPSAVPMRELAADPDLRGRALELIAAMDRGEETKVWFWKDPRLPATLPFWEKVWTDPVYVVTCRNPRDIAGSLARRDGLPFTAALLLWQFSMLAVLGCVERARARFFAGYEKLLSDPEGECRRLFAFLGETCGAPPGGSPADPAAAARAVDPALRRCGEGVPLAACAEATKEQKEFELFLSRKLENPGEPFDPAAFPLYPGWRDYLLTFQRLKRAELIIRDKDSRIREIRRSISYRLGRALTKPFRLLRGR